MADRIVWGYVDGTTGKALEGSGFTVVWVDKGLYTIVFDQPFTNRPAVVVSEVYTGNPDYHGGDTRDNAVVVGIAPDQFRLETGQSNGEKDNRWFTFIAIGI
jgi:hypothetical protein